MSLADFFDRMGTNFSNNVSDAGPMGLASLGAAIASAPRNQWGSAIAQGLGGMTQMAQAERKKRTLSDALKGAMGDLTPQQQQYLDALEPDQAAGIVGEQLFKDKKQSGPFQGHGMESSSANIIVRGQMDPALRASPEYAIAYSSLTTPRVITDAEGRQMLYRPEVPKGIQPPTSSQPAAPAPSTVAMPTQTPPPPAATPAAPAPGPMQMAEMEQPPQNTTPVVTAIPGGGTATVIPGTGAKPGEGEVAGIRNQLNTVLPSMEKAINSYEAALDDTTRLQRLSGPLGGGPMANLGTLHTNLLLQAKELYALGVLNGPDYMLMTKMVDDPESVTAGFRGREGLKAQIKAFRRILNEKVEDYKARAGALGVRGIVPQAAGPQSTKPDPLGIR